MIAARIRNVIAHLTQISGLERGYHDYDERSYALHCKINALVNELRAVAEVADALERSVLLPSAKATTGARLCDCELGHNGVGLEHS